MLKQDSEAHIVNTASTSGLIMNSYAVPYGVSKHAVVALSESLFLELESRRAKVGVSVLCPGPHSDPYEQSPRGKESRTFCAPNTVLMEIVQSLSQVPEDE